MAEVASSCVAAEYQCISRRPARESNSLSTASPLPLAGPSRPLRGACFEVSTIFYQRQPIFHQREPLFHFGSEGIPRCAVRKAPATLGAEAKGRIIRRKKTRPRPRLWRRSGRPRERGYVRFSIVPAHGSSVFLQSSRRAREPRAGIPLDRGFSWDSRV